ncbi:MAG TPA: VWA domain-containing protein [Candidatus Acidoferrum sp.]|nr:VWA domain-containing protein [Candidatus Acidoferrum sp.]
MKLSCQHASSARLYLLSSLLVILGCGLAFGQEPIHVAVNLVNVAFSVRDSRGTLVDSLAKEDVEVFEDAVPQKISFFARSTDVPLTLGLIVDVSGSQDHFTKQHQQDLEVFLKEVLGSKDRAFLVTFANHIRLISDFSPSGAEIIERMKEYQGKDKGKDKKKHAEFPELGPAESRDLGTAFYDSIYYSVTEKLARENGRRALLLFSDGEDNSSSHDMMTTIEKAQAENVVVYAIRYTEKSHGQLTARNMYGTSVMDRIAKETGGAHIDAEVTDPHTYFRQIAEELRTSYEVGYYPTNSGRDDTFRKIVIRPKQAGLRIRTKTGYFSR